MLLAALALAGPAAAGAATTPSASSPTTIEDDAPAAEAVAEEPRRRHGGPDWGAIERVQQDIAAQRAADAAKAAREAADAGRLARQEIEDRQSVLDMSFPVPVTPPPPPPPEPSYGPPLIRDQMWQGEPQGYAGPPPRDDTANYIAAFAIVGGAATWYWLQRNGDTLGPRLRAAWSAFCIWRRANAALLIVVGAALVAASLTILRPDNLSGDFSEIRDLLRDGWLTFAGALVAIIGLYDKIRPSPPDKI
jgi:hypothetical protein